METKLVLENQNSTTSISSMSPNVSSNTSTNSDAELIESVVYDDRDGYNDPTGMLPGTDDYPGPLNFQLFLNTEDKSKRSWLYSTHLKKLYIDINKVVCVQFKLKRTPSGDANTCCKDALLVRALPVYAAPEFLQEPVIRCPVHVMTDKKKAEKSNDQSVIPWLYHVLRAEHHEASYHSNTKSNRHSVVVPLHTPTLGSEFVTIMYKFTCKTSCAFGLNRRPVHVIFTLETAQGEILGRRKLLVKICSCPKRDLHRDEHVSKTEVDTNGRKRRIKEVDNSLSYSSMEVYSPPNKEIKLEHVEEEEIEEEYILPALSIPTRLMYMSTLETLHSHFLGLSVRHDALLELHPHISRMAELLDKARNEARESDGVSTNNVVKTNNVVSTNVVLADISSTNVVLADVDSTNVLTDVGSTNVVLTRVVEERTVNVENQE